MAKVGSSIVVTGLTGSALAVVTMLALQAKSSATVAAPGTPTSGGASATGPATAGKSGKTTTVAAVPAGTGTDKRVVYSLSQHRVWLVDAGAKTAKLTFTVQPSAVSPLVGSYTVTRQSESPYIGSDGAEIEDGVIFAQNDGVPIGFSAAVDGSMASPAPGKHTGGIRETVADGKALFAFTQVGSPVIVVQ